MAIRLADSRREALVRNVQGFHLQEFEEEISHFKAEQLVDFFLEALGPQVYNQAVTDARGFMQRKLEELDGEIHAPEAF